MPRYRTLRHPYDPVRNKIIFNRILAQNSTQESHLETVKSLIKAGTDPDEEVLYCLAFVDVDEDKRHLLGAGHLHIAADKGHLEVMRLLLKEAGANPNKAQ